MISNGKDNLISQGSILPNLRNPVSKWGVNMQFVIITKTIVDGEVVETPTAIDFKGVIQNFSTTDLILKPEGQRDWAWKMVHSLTALALKPDDIIVYNGIRYRVMKMRDFSEYGYYEYHIISGYTES
jgi:hypothetical protein